MSEHENNIYKAKSIERAERYDEMVDAMEKVALPALFKILDLTEEERNLLSVFYKNVTKKRRASLKITSSMERKEMNNNFHKLTEKQAEELNDVYSSMLNVLEKQLIPSASTSESRVFYYTLKGDYHRYLSELATGNDQKDIENSLIAYKAASDIAVIDLPPTNRIRLYLALNFSMFYDQILNSPIAAVAVDDIVKLEELWRSDNEIQKNVIQRYLDGVIITEDDPGILIEFRGSRLLEFRMNHLTGTPTNYFRQLLNNPNFTAEDLIASLAEELIPLAGGHCFTRTILALMPNDGSQYTNVSGRLFQIICDPWFQSVLARQDHQYGALLGYVSFLKSNKLNEMVPLQLALGPHAINPFDTSVITKG